MKTLKSALYVPVTRRQNGSKQRLQTASFSVTLTYRERELERDMGDQRQGQAAAARGTPVANSVTRIGLLFVHGIGEQKRFEHLRETVGSFAELMRAAYADNPTARVSIVDRTTDWKIPPSQPDIESDAPATMSLRIDGVTPLNIDFECHEVWWADLGYRTGLFASILFWIWGLGQWSAPIYREMDASGADKRHALAPQAHPAVGPKALTAMPRSVAGQPLAEVWTRFRLLLAGLAALFTAVTWTLAKRVLRALFSKAPSSTLIVDYVGDVHQYEERGSPSDTSLPDPGFPPRVGIRRRMVTEMVAMAGRGLDGWYVVAHSLGTVLAYNGLTETGQALPNYLDKAQWGQVKPGWTRDAGTKGREDTGAMMPARPSWLHEDDVINRAALFERFQGFLTYGSPLNKFAALWPRVVATATDRVDGANVFHGKTWLNLAAPNDPVAGNLARFGANSAVDGVLPTRENRATPLGLDFIVSHLHYFSPAERLVRGQGREQKLATMKWLAQGMDAKNPAPLPTTSTWPSWLTGLLSAIGYLLIVIVLWLALVSLAAIAGDSFKAVMTASVTHWSSWHDFVLRAAWFAGPILAVALLLLLVFGLYRWSRESYLNMRLGHYDRLRWQIMLLLWCQFAASLVMVAATAAMLWSAWLILHGAGSPVIQAHLLQVRTLAVSQIPEVRFVSGLVDGIGPACLLLAAMLCQAFVNALVVLGAAVIHWMTNRRLAA